MSEGTAAGVADLLKRARKRYGCTQVELAKAAGTDQATVARIEAGRTVPTLDMVARLAAATGHTALLRLTAGPRAWQTAL
jgi:transcriptional regulator with XRE-family HTH domain